MQLPAQSNNSWRYQPDLTSASQLPADSDAAKEILATALQMIVAENEELDDNLVYLEGRAAFARDQLETVHYSLWAELLSKEANVRTIEESLLANSLEDVLPMAKDIASLEREVAAREEQQAELRMECGRIGEHLRLQRRRCTLEAFDAQISELNTFVGSDMAGGAHMKLSESRTAMQAPEQRTAITQALVQAVHGKEAGQRRCTSLAGQGQNVSHPNDSSSALSRSRTPEKALVPLVSNAVPRKPSNGNSQPPTTNIISKHVIARPAAEVRGTMPCMRSKSSKIIYNKILQSSAKCERNASVPAQVEIDLVNNSVVHQRAQGINPANCKPAEDLEFPRPEESASKVEPDEQACIVQ